jgi:hypothetical protein
MELLVSVILVFIVTFAIFGIVDMIRQTKKVNIDTMGTIGSKPKTQTDYQMEHKVEQEKGDIDFMHKWIQEKSGKKDPVSQKRKPKTTKEWEDEFDIGGNS